MVMTPALISISTFHELSHFAVDFGSSVIFLRIDGREIDLEEFDVFNLLFSWPLPLPSSLFQERFHTNSICMWLLFSIILIWQRLDLMIFVIGTKLHDTDINYENDYKQKHMKPRLVSRKCLWKLIFVKTNVDFFEVFWFLAWL